VIGRDLPAEGRDFPSVSWFGDMATFVPGPPGPCERPWAVVVFVICGGRFVLADVPRGWCTPSGRVEPDEGAEDAARRETLEETGAEIVALRRIGAFVVQQDGRRVRSAAVFLARAETLGPLPAGTESNGAGLFARDEIPHVYWHWDTLMASMFDYAWALARVPVGQEEARG